MKPQLIRAENLTHSQQLQVTSWLKANGCPYLMPYEATIRITGNYFTVGTWTIRTTRQSGTLWPSRLGPGWKPRIKIRKYRIRNELRWTT